MSRPLASLLLVSLFAPGCAKEGGVASPGARPGGGDEVVDITADLSAPLPIDPKVRVGQLRNGLTYYIEPNARPQDRAELRLAVKVGSVLEDDDQLGMAHFVEHMAFNGTEHFAGNELVAYLESVGTQFGAHLNAYTSFDETVYQLQLPTDDPVVMENGFLVLRDWAGGVVFDPEECERERGVVLEEWRRGLGIQDRIQAAMLPTLFHGSRYADRLPIGTEESLQTQGCANARRFYETWYRPELMAVMAVGDFDPDRVERLIKSYFGDLRNPPGAPERAWYTVPGHDEMLVTVFTDPELSQGAMVVLDKVPDIEGDTHAAYREFLLEQLVFLMMNERLAIAGQDPDAPALGAFATEGPLGHLRAAQSLTIVPKAGRELDALRAGLVELERVKRHGFTAGELRRARDELARNMQRYYDERDKTDSRTHVEELLRVYLTDEPMPGIPYEYALSQAYLPDIDLDEVNRWSRDVWFPGRSRVVQAILPESEAVDVPSEARIREVFAEVAAMTVPPPEDDLDDAPLMTELPEPGTATRVAQDPALGTTTWRLSNGVTVVLKPTDFQADEVLFEAFSTGGTSLVPDDAFIPAVTATSLLLRSGVGEHEAVALAKMLAGKTARVSPTIGRTREFLSGGASVRDLETMFQLLYLGVTEPRFEPRALALERQARLEALRHRQASPDAVFEDTFTALVWGDDPRQTNWTIEEVEQLDLEASERIYRERFGDFDDWTFVFVGNIDEATLVPLMERYLATLPTRPGTETWRDDGSRRVTGVHELEMPRGQTPRSRARILFHGPFEPTPVSREVLDATGSVLETRLLEELRENLGGTYGVHVGESATLEPTGTYAVQIEFETDPERLDELLARTWDIVDEVRTTTYPDAGIASIREKNRRSHETASRTNAWWLGALAGALARGEDPAIGILRYDELNRQVTGEAIRRMAEQVLDEDQYIQAIQRPQSSAADGRAAPAGAAAAR